MSSGKVEAALVDSVLVASTALVGLAARSMQVLDGRVSLVQWRLLVVLHTHGPLSAGEAAAALDTTPSSLSRLADRLEAAGLVRREGSPVSRRLVCLQLTPEGRSVVGTVLRRRRRELRAVLATLPVEDREALALAFATFSRAAEAYFDGEVPAAL